MSAELSSDYSEVSCSSEEDLPPSKRVKIERSSFMEESSKVLDVACEPSADEEQPPLKGDTIKASFKRQSKDLTAKFSAMEKLLTKTSTLSHGEYFLVDASDAPDHMFKLMDRSAVVVDLPLILKSTRQIKYQLSKFFGGYQKHLKNKSINLKRLQNKPSSSIKGRNCTCILKAPLMKFLELIKDSFVTDEGVPVLSRMPMMRRGLCKKMAFQQFMDHYNKVNKLFHPKVNQWRKFDEVMYKCMDSNIPSDKLYIKLPVDLNEKEIDLTKIKHPKMLALMSKISRPSPSKKGKSVVSVYRNIENGKITKRDYLDAIPNITDSCRAKLMGSFNPPEDGAELKVLMSVAVEKKMVERPLNSVELAYMTKPDFDPACYPPFCSNSLNTMNEDTITDLRPRHTLGEDDEPNRLKPYFRIRPT